MNKHLENWDHKNARDEDIVSRLKEEIKSRQEILDRSPTPWNYETIQTENEYKLLYNILHLLSQK